MATGIPALLRQVRGDRLRQDVAADLKVTPSTYGRWERGQTEFPPERLPWLAEAAGVDLDEVESAWKMETGARAMRRKTGATDDADFIHVIREVSARQEQIARVVESLADRLDAMEGRKPTRPPAKKPATRRRPRSA